MDTGVGASNSSHPVDVVQLTENKWCRSRDSNPDERWLGGFKAESEGAANPSSARQASYGGPALRSFSEGGLYSPRVMDTPVDT
jgi:hypothetical protein